MPFFNSKAKKVQGLADTILSYASKLTDGLTEAFGSELPDKERKDFLMESVYLFLHLASRIGDRELNNSQNNDLFNLLSRTVAEKLVSSGENIKKRKEKEAAIRKFYDTLSQMETEYSMCTDGFIESEPFSEKALFSKYAGKIVASKSRTKSGNSSKENDSQWRKDMTKVLEMFLRLYPKMNLEQEVINIGRSLYARTVNSFKNGKNPDAITSPNRT